MFDWQKDSTKGVINQIKKSIEKNGELLECWKQYLKTMNKDSLAVMFSIDSSFMETVTKEI